MEIVIIATMNHVGDSKKSIIFLIKNGFLHIFSASIINKIIQFCSGVVLIRFFQKVEYGQYSYAGNILNLFLLVEGLGVCSGLLQYASENRENKTKLSYVKLSIRYGGTFNFFLGLVVFVFSLFFTLPIEGSVEILRWMFLIPFFTLFFNIIETYLRSALKNLAYSALSVMNTALFLICSVIGVIWYGVWGVIVGRYIAYLITDIVALFVIRKEVHLMRTIPLPDKQERQSFLKYSITCMMSNSISGLLYLIDTFLVGLIIKESTVVAAYKTATIIPFAISFIPESVITFVYPYFARTNNDKVKFRKYYSSLIKYLGVINSFISLVLYFLAPWLIKFVFGNSYSDSVLPFRILAIGYFFAGTFRIPAGNMLGALRKVKINLYNAIICGVLNIILDIYFILWWGPKGASISTVSIYIISGFISNSYLFYYLNKKVDISNNE